MVWDYSADAAAAVEDISDAGRAMTLERKTNTGTPSRPSMTTVTSDVTVVFFNREERDGSGQVTHTRQLAYIAPNAATAPEANDIIEAPDGARFEIVMVSPLNPGGTVLLYQADIGTA